MFRRLLLFLFAALFLFATACAYRRVEPRQETPRPQAETPQRPQTTPVPFRDELAKSDEEAVEENINGTGLEEDLNITENAESKKDRQELTGLTQQEAEQLRRETGESPINDVLEEYQTTLPDEIEEALQYEQYPLSYDYFLVTAEEQTQIRSDPTPESTILCETVNGEKLTLLQRVEGETVGDSSIWYKVSCKENGTAQTGYIHAAAGLPRQFRFAQMLQALRDLEQHANDSVLHFISNYKNYNGAPPEKDNGGTDEFGLRIYQSAPGYTEANTQADFRYLPDGFLVRILDETDDFYKVNALTFDGEHFVPKRYIEDWNQLSQLSHIIIVDRGQQNQCTFELGENGVVLLSYTLSTTGLQGDYSFETPLGYYKALQKRERFQYLRDGSTDIAGYAPYAIRFTGGAYIHGVPVDYQEKDGELIDPGTKEYLHTIGTFPRSHMCVRNFTSHAQFLYEWMEPEVGAIIIIE